MLGLAAAAALMPWRGPREGAMPRRRLQAPWRLACWTWWGLLALLLLSGGVRGEVGRIWLIWMPFACLFAAPAAVRLGARRQGLPPGEAHGGRALGTAPDRADSASEAPAGIAPRWPLGLLLATEGALTLALGASMIFVN